MSNLLTNICHKWAYTFDNNEVDIVHSHQIMMSCESQNTIFPEVLIGNQERYTQLMWKFKSVDPGQIAALVDYDGTISPLQMNSWDTPSLTDSTWPNQASVLRTAFTGGLITEKEFWQQSINMLNVNGFAGSTNDLTNACLPIRNGVPQLFQICSQLGRFIVYSAGINEVIDKHVAKIAEIFESAKPQVVANKLNGADVIFSSSKNGITLVRRLFEQGDDLSDVSHFILIGDSLSDAGMADGLDSILVLKIGLLSTKKANDPKIKAQYIDAFDIVFIDDISVEGAKQQISQILNRN